MPSIIQAGNTASSGLVTTGATDGILELRSGTAVGGTVAMTINANGAVSSPTSFNGALNGSLGATTPSAVVATTITARPAANQNLQIRDNGNLSIAAFNDAGNAFVPMLLEASSFSMSTGLAVTGGVTTNTLDASGLVTFASGADKGIQFYNAGASDGLIKSIDNNSTFTSIAVNKTQVKIFANNSLVANVSSTGLAVTGALSCTGSLSKGSGSFRVDHPLPDKTSTHQLVHSFIEGPKADLIYRGRVALVNGQATVNIDAAATMTEGTFVVLCRDVQCFTTNETDWICVRGSVAGNILTIEAEDTTATSVVSWMVIGERHDPHMMETEWTDENGRVIVEPLKAVPPQTLEEQT